MPNFKGIVNSVMKLDRTWQYQGKTMYVFEVSVGQHKGEYSSQSGNQNKFVTGQEVEYTYEPNSNERFLGKIKPVQQQGGGNAYSGAKGGSKPYVKEDADEKLASMAYSYTKDLINGGKVDIKHINEIAEKIAFGIQNLATKLKAAKPKEVEAPQATSDPRAQYATPQQRQYQEPNVDQHFNDVTPPFNDDLPF